MYSNYNPYYRGYQQTQNNDERFVGGFLGPFLLGGITGGLLAPAFYPNRPYYNNYYYNTYPNYTYPNYYYYGGYYK